MAEILLKVLKVLKETLTPIKGLSPTTEIKVHAHLYESYKKSYLDI